MGMREQIVRALAGRAAAPLAGKPGGVWEGGIRAYHSSPHDFEKVDFSKLRTGEGANVYGAGHYMAENPAVSGQGGQYWQSFLDRFPAHERSAADTLKSHDFDRMPAIAETLRNVEDWRSMIAKPREAITGVWTSPEDQIKYYQKMLDQRQAEFDLLRSNNPVGPRTYEMNLRAKPEELLDWDKPPAAQTEPVRRAIDSIMRPLATDYTSHPDLGTRSIQSVMYDMAHPKVTGSQVNASAALADAGVPGIRYLDQGSRNVRNYSQGMIDNYGSPEAALEKARRFAATAEGDAATHYARIIKELETPQSYNYVGVDPSKLEVLAKYGVAGAAAIPPTLGAFTAQDKYEVPDGVR